MEECVFCKIAKGKIPCFKIYEDKDFLAFLDINPWVEGHTLVIPKKHYRWVWDLPDDLAGKYFAVVNKIANHYRKVLNIEFIMSWIYGWEVPHAHIHLFPDARGKVAFYPKEKLGTLTPEKGNELVKRLSLK
jgi:histidine triad (HIT) family protein